MINVLEISLQIVIYAGQLLHIALAYACIADYLLLDLDGSFGSQGQGEAVAGPGIYLTLLGVALDGETSIVDPALQVVNEHIGDAGGEALQDGDEKIVGHGPGRKLS